MAVVGLIPRLLAIALLPWAIYNCIGGSVSSLPPDSPMQPVTLEQQVIDRAAGVVGYSHPTRIYRDWYTPGPDGRTWEAIGADLCTPEHDPRWCAHTRIEHGRILIAHWSPAVVGQFNATAATGEQLDPCLFSLRRLASLIIHESHHLPPYDMQHGEAMSLADREAMGEFLALHGAWLAEREVC